MKAVLISIKPKWCELIASGKKTIEVRKTKPKLDTPFKCYIYETKGRTEIPTFIDEDGHEIYQGRGQVIGEFVCDKIYEIGYDYFCPVGYEVSMGEISREELYKKSCLSFNQIDYYLNMELGYGWHISKLVIYDKPRDLSEFKTLCPDFYDGKHCDECEYFIDGRGYEYDESDCGCDGLKPLKRPPQSWCYVESEADTE